MYNQFSRKGWSTDAKPKMIQMLNYLLNKDFKGVIISMNPWRKGECAFWQSIKQNQMENLEL